MPINSTPAEIRCQDFGSWFLLPPLSGPVLPSSKDPSWAEFCLSTSSPSKGPSLFLQPWRDDCRQQHPLKSDHVLPLPQKLENQQLFSSTGNLVKRNRTALSVPRPVCKGHSLPLMDRRWEPGPIHCSHIMLAMPGLGLKILMSSHSRWICLWRVLSWPRRNLKQSSFPLFWSLREIHPPWIEKPPKGQNGTSASGHFTHFWVMEDGGAQLWGRPGTPSPLKLCEQESPSDRLEWAWGLNADWFRLDFWLGHLLVLLVS